MIMSKNNQPPTALNLIRPGLGLKIRLSFSDVLLEKLV